MIIVFLRVTEELNAVSGVMIIYPSSNAPGVVFHSVQSMRIRQNGYYSQREKGSGMMRTSEKTMEEEFETQHGTNATNAMYPLVPIASVKSSLPLFPT